MTDPSESSDDELFNPVGFLSDNRTNPDVKTPEKSLTPIGGNTIYVLQEF